MAVDGYHEDWDEPGLFRFLAQIGQRAHDFASAKGADGFFMDVADWDDCTFISRMNLMGEAVVNALLTGLLEPTDLGHYRDRSEGLPTKVYDASTRTVSVRTVNTRSPYVDKLHLACDRVMDLQEGQFLFAVARVRNSYAHDLRFLNKRLLDVIHSRFGNKESPDIIDALMPGLYGLFGTFHFEQDDVTRDGCGEYTGFRGHRVERKMSYTALNLIAHRSARASGAPLEDEDDEPCIDSEFRNCITHKMKQIAGITHAALRARTLEPDSQDALRNFLAKVVGSS